MTAHRSFTLRLLVRTAPLLFALPLVIPVIWRTRWLAGPLLYIWNLGRRADRDIRPPF